MPSIHPIPLVGAYHRPPASLVLQHLRGGATLQLRAEPENPYDPLAIQVWCDVGQVPASQLPTLADALPGAGWDLDSLLATPVIQLGFLCSATNRRQLSKAPPGEIWGANDQLRVWPTTATLSWSGNGQPLVLVGAGDQ